MSTVSDGEDFESELPANLHEPEGSGNERDDSECVVRNRKVQFRFDVCTDELLAKEVVAHNPYEADFGAVGPTWERVADALAVGVDGRRCRERIKLLVNGRKRRVAALETASGIEETVTDLDAMLDEIITIQESSQAIQADKKKAEKASAEKADKIAEEIRQKAMEGMKPREKRKSLSSEDSALLAFLETRQAAESSAKRHKLALEERRLALEERRLELAEERAKVEMQERAALINLIVTMAAKNGSSN